MLSSLIHFDVQPFVLELSHSVEFSQTPHSFFTVGSVCHVCDALKNYDGLCFILLLLARYNNVELRQFDFIHFIRMEMSMFGVSRR